MDHRVLTSTLLFRGITPEEAEGMLHCLQAVRRQYPKGAVILRTGDVTEELGLVLSGRVSIESDDIWGNRSILDHAEVGQVFGEAYACLPGEPLMISAVAAEPCEVLFLNTDRVLRLCANTCPFHDRLVRNLLAITARKNLNLSRRIFHTGAKSIRGRLLSYLAFQSAKQGSRSFEIPFNRQQLADYLSVDRSALSNELSKMQRDGLLQYNRNHFTLTADPESLP